MAAEDAYVLANEVLSGDARVEDRLAKYSMERDGDAPLFFRLHASRWRMSSPSGRRRISQSPDPNWR
jgi:hypothetical protein